MLPTRYETYINQNTDSFFGRVIVVSVQWSHMGVKVS